MKPAEERIWRCSCGGAHFLTIRQWGNDDPGYFLVDSTYGGNLAQRLKQAVKHVLGRGHGDAWVELCLDEPMVREVRDHLNDLLPRDQQIHYNFNANTAGQATISYRG
jgi:ferredoxin-NADP reductase